MPEQRAATIAKRTALMSAETPAGTVGDPRDTGQRLDSRLANAGQLRAKNSALSGAAISSLAKTSIRQTGTARKISSHSASRAVKAQARLALFLRGPAATSRTLGSGKARWKKSRNESREKSVFEPQRIGWHGQPWPSRIGGPIDPRVGHQGLKGPRGLARSLAPANPWSEAACHCGVALSCSGPRRPSQLLL